MNTSQYEHHFIDTAGRPAGGISTGIGYTIAWQNGPCPLVRSKSGIVSQPSRNGAFLIEVLEACRTRLEAYPVSEFACGENEAALEAVKAAIRCLEDRRDRRDRRKDAGTLGTHEKD